MSKPDNYKIAYEINPWMNIESKVNHRNAFDQWEHLTQCIKECSIQVELIDSVEGLPDMVFTANAALIINNTAYLSNFRYPERKPERVYNQQWFLDHRIKIDNYAMDNHLNFEGEGDALLVGPDKLFAGYGFRSDRAYYRYLEDTLGIKIIYCELVNPHFYHLDTCFCPIDSSTAIWWPQAFSKASQELIQQEIDVIDVPEREALQFCCNAIVSDKNIIMPIGCSVLKEQLEKRGFNVLCCDMSEFIKAGGACKCLCLKI